MPELSSHKLGTVDIETERIIHTRKTGCLVYQNNLLPLIDATLPFHASVNADTIVWLAKNRASPAMSLDYADHKIIECPSRKSSEDR